MFQRVGVNEGGVSLPTAIQYLLLTSHDMKSLGFDFCHDIFIGLKVGMPVFQPFYEMKLKTSKFNRL